MVTLTPQKLLYCDHCLIILENLINHHYNIVRQLQWDSQLPKLVSCLYSLLKQNTKIWFLLRFKVLTNVILHCIKTAVSSFLNQFFSSFITKWTLLPGHAIICAFMTNNIVGKLLDEIVKAVIAASLLLITAGCSFRPHLICRVQLSCLPVYCPPMQIPKPCKINEDVHSTKLQLPLLEG